MTSSDTLVTKRLQTVYVIVLVILGLLSCSSFFMLESVIDDDKTSAAEINVSGRQRMLSQQIALRVMVLAGDPAARAEPSRWRALSARVELMSRSHAGLVHGSMEMGLSPPQSEPLRALYFGPSANVDRALNDYLFMARLFCRARTIDAAERLRRALVIREAAVPLLRDLDRVVRQYQRDSEAKDERLQVMHGVTLVVSLLTLLASGLFIFRPMAVRIHSFVTQLREREERFHSLTDSCLATAMIGVDEHEKVILWNPAAELILGYSRDEMLGVAVWKIVPDAQRGAHAAAFERARSRGKLVHTGAPRELVARHKNGALIPIEVSLGTWEQGGRLHFSAIIHDISERKKHERALASALREAEAASRAKSEFLATMSHEIRTPMNGVIGMLDVLSHSTLSPDAEQMVLMVRSSANSLVAIINDILDFSKIEAGKMALSVGPMSVEDEIDGVCQLLTNVALEKKVELTAFFEPSIPPAVVGDPLRLRQVLVNLVGNAIKFSAGLDRVGRVQVRVTVQQRDARMVEVRFDVVDNGVGIEGQALKRLFHSFEQADSSTTRKYGGTGLGLAISKSLVKLMGGEIAVESEPDCGSTFTVKMPFQIPDDSADANNRSFDLSGVQCIVVCDEPSLATDYRRYLVAAGARVRSFDALSEARELFRSEVHPAPPCVVVIGMPGGQPTAEVAAIFESADANVELSLVHLTHARDRQERRRGAPLSAERVRQIELEGLTRRAFLGAVIRAIGCEQAQLETPSRPTIATPSRDEALRQDQLILVADDNDTNLQVLRRQLNLLGYAADLVSDGGRAYREWQHTRYGLLLTDLHMPNLDGYELVQQIRSDEQAQGKEPMPIIAITANGLKSEQERCLQLGMNGYLTKPLALEKLDEALQRWLPRPVDIAALSP